MLKGVSMFKKIVGVVLVAFFSSSAYAVLGGTADTGTGKTIYLTFDDGPIDVTRNVVDVLKQNNIKATFFINGVHMFGNGGEDEGSAVSALIYALENGELIGNHSYDHMLGYHTCNTAKIPGGSTGTFYNKFCAHDYAASAYFNPVVDYTFFAPLNTTGIRDVIYDSEYKIAGKAVTAQGFYKNDQLDTLARLPYTNDWRVNTAAADGGLNASVDLSTSDKNGSLLADKLAANGYSVYGWDLEWGPTDWSNPHPVDTLQTAAQLETSTAQAFNQCFYHCSTNLNSHTLHKNKVVILTHDFFFEDSWRGSGAKNLAELDRYIKAMKAKGYKFATLDTYK